MGWLELLLGAATVSDECSVVIPGELIGNTERASLTSGSGPARITPLQKDIMPSNSSRLLSKINLPLALLWLVSVVIAVLGYVLMASSNSEQAAIYTSGEADYAKLFAAQSAGTVGGLLIAVGVLGLLLALTAQAVTRHRGATPEVAALDIAVLDTTEFDKAEFDTEPLPEATEIETPATDAAEPAAENATDPEPAVAR